MRHSAKILLPAIAASLVLAACGGSSTKSSASNTTATGSGAASGAGATVKTASVSGKTVLVSSEGMTLYHLTAEGGGKFICTASSCLAIWRPLTVSAGATPTGAVGAIGVVKRPDGTTQVAYKGMPLYTFAQDKAPGEANGQGIKDAGTWSVIAVSAPASGSAGSTGGSAPAETSAPAGGY